GDSGDRVEIDLPDVAVPREELLKLLLVLVEGSDLLHLVRVRIGPSLLEAGLAALVEFDREVLEAHCPSPPSRPPRPGWLLPCHRPPAARRRRSNRAPTRRVPHAGRRTCRC